MISIASSAQVTAPRMARDGSSPRRGRGCVRAVGGHFTHVDFEALYRATYPRVVAYARSVASREDADDAVAEAYAIAWRRQRDIPRDAELGWLIGVTRRVLANARRSRRRSGALHALLDLQPRFAGPDPAERVEDG